MLFLSLLCLMAVFSPIADSARPFDEIYLSNFNQSFYIKDETFTFELRPEFKVPLNIVKHTIYTATTETVQSITKRAIFDVAATNDLEELSEDDYDHLRNLVGGEVPYIVRINNQKRSLPETSEGVKVIPLSSKGHAILSFNTEESKKRGVALGGKFCLHVPFATTCENGYDVQELKDTLNAVQDAFETEIDSYKKTNDLRDLLQAKTLRTQADLVAQVAGSVSNAAVQVVRIANAVSVNAAQTMHGDYIIHSQVNYLKRVTNNLLKYAETLASTDPRAVTAQPALTKLFQGYETVRKYLIANDIKPIVDTREFNWTEILLPANAVTNIVTPTSAVSTSSQYYFGFRLFITGSCSSYVPASNYECQIESRDFFSGVGFDPSLPGAYRHARWVYGPFHMDHVGIYNLQDPATANLTGTMTMNPVLPTIRQTGLLIDDPNPTLYCVDFLGFKVLSSFNSTPSMINGIPTNARLSPLSDCNSYLLRDPIAGFTIGPHYRLFGVYEGIVVPFYSNCDKTTFQNLTAVPIGWMSQFPSTQGSSNQNDITTMELYLRHYVTSDCYMNLDPSWFGLSYYINESDVQVVKNIPKGFKLNQFTINPEGELSSSLEFVYTSNWVWVYRIHRVSNNRVIPDEIETLDGELVLFQLNGSKIVDESDDLYGLGNNGRDCIRQAPTYEHELTECFYQNDQKGYTASQYLTGLIPTTGIARYVHKFNFRVEEKTIQGEPAFLFNLTAKDEADFNFYVLMDGQVCPRLNSQSTSSTSGCSLGFTYFGTEQATLVNVNSNNFVTKPSDISLVFNQQTATANVDFGLWRLVIGTKECYLLNCIFEFSDTALQVRTPKVQIHSEEDKRLTSTVELAIGSTIGDTINDMNNVTKLGYEVIENITQIVKVLGGFDFNVSKKYPYEDFTDLRARVRAHIDGIKSVSEAGGECSGLFSGIACFFSDLVGRIITIVIIIAIIIGVYLVCFKCGLAKKIFSGRKKNEFA